MAYHGVLLLQSNEVVPKMPFLDRYRKNGILRKFCAKFTVSKQIFPPVFGGGGRAGARVFDWGGDIQIFKKFSKNDDYRNVLHKIQAAGACTLCMSPSHHASSCNRRGEQSCEYCKTKNIPGHNTHHVVVCPKKPKREQVNIGGEIETSLPDEFYD